jgi:hypothetical protein
MRELTFGELNKVSGGSQVCVTTVVCDECGCVTEAVCRDEDNPSVPVR